jgi:dipeptidyl aminopeptidase/acylaminoacyl peptidase
MTIQRTPIDSRISSPESLFNPGEGHASAGFRRILRCVSRSFARVLASCLLVVASNTIAQTGKPLPVEDALKMRIFGEYDGVAPSPDGKFIAYVVRPAARNGSVSPPYLRTGVPLTAQRADIWVLDVVTGKERNVTRGMGNNWRPTWSPNGRLLAFLSDRDGSTQGRLWVWDPIDDSLRRVSEANVRGDEITWTPDGQSVLIEVIPVSLSLDEYIGRFDLSQKSPEPTSQATTRATVTVYRSGRSNVSEIASSPWTLDWALRDLALIDLATGKLQAVVQGQHVATYQISEDGTEVLYTNAKRFARPGSQETLFDVVRVNLHSQQSKVLISDVPMGLGGEDFALSPSGSRLVYRAGGDDGPSFHVLNMTSGNSRELKTWSFRGQETRGLSQVPLWDEAGDSMYFLREGILWNAGVEGNDLHEVARIPGHRITQLIAKAGACLWVRGTESRTVVLAKDNVNNQDGFYEVELRSGRSRKLLEDGQCFSCALQSTQIMTADGQHLFYYAETVDRASDLWMTDPEFENLRRLTHLNPEFDQYRMGQVRVINWLSDDGEPLHGALLLPSDYQEGKRYPLITWVYGGRLLSGHFNHFGLAYFGAFNMQLFATRGYAVLLPDSPQHEGTSMLDLAKTILPGVNKAVELGIAEPRRLGVIGHSNGGYGVLGLIVQTKRFKAAVDLAGAPDLVGLYTEMNRSGGAFGTSLLEQGQIGMGGTLWQYRERYIENSPLFYFDRIETPLLIIHGEEDEAVAPFLGDAAFVALRRLGKEVEYAKYAGENHSPLYWSYGNQIDLCARMITWFDGHLNEAEPIAQKKQ